jgi:hypothetical protein
MTPHRLDQNQTIPMHTIRSKEDPRPLVTVSMIVMTVVHFIKVSALHPWVVISSLAKRLEKPPFCHSYTSFGAWPRDHYMPLQRFTIGVCHALLRFPDKRPRLQCWGFPHTVAPFAPCGSGSSHRMPQRQITKIGAIPTQPSMTHNL